MKKLNLVKKKNNIIEIQVNGGKDMTEKVNFAKSLFEKEVTFDSVFEQDEMLDVVGVTRGHGVTGVIKRFGVAHL